MADILGLTLNDSNAFIRKKYGPRHYQDGGFYVIDDMHPRSNWTETHSEKALKLIAYLDMRDDFQLTKKNWASGIIVAVKLNSHNIG